MKVFVNKMNCFSEYAMSHFLSHGLTPGMEKEVTDPQFLHIIAHSPDPITVVYRNEVFEISHPFQW